MNELIVFLISITTFGFGMNENCLNDSTLNGYATTSDDGSNYIYICDKENWGTPIMYDDITYHELGHIFWYRLLTEKQREERKKLYEYSLKKDLFLTEYSKKDEVEDFAETFSDLYFNKDTEFVKSLLIKKIILHTKIPNIGVQNSN